jgi:hypothetical protein
MDQMSEEKAERILDELRLFLLNEPSIDNDFTGQITIHLNRGGISAGVDINKRIRKSERVSVDN